MQVEGCERVYPIADEDLERQTEEKTSSVHFLRFELSPAMVTACIGGASLAAGIDHPAYSIEVNPVDEGIARSLSADLAAVAIN